MKLLLWALGAMAWCTLSSRAEPIVRDLDLGLGYIRITALPADLPVKPGPGSWVLDLRYAAGEASAAPALHAWLRQYASVHRPVFILINADTSPVLCQQLTPRSALPGVLTLGSTTADFTPDIPLVVSPAREARAYAALPSTPDITTLVTVAPTKLRRDEAAMLVAQANGEPLAAEPETKLTDEVPATATETPLLDFTLQRAVQIHRAWSFLHAQNP